MAYNANIPQPGDLLSQSQGQILANFQALAGAATSTLPYVLLPIQGSDPVVSTTQMALYTKTSSIAGYGQPAMFIERASGDTKLPNPVEFTSYVYGQAIVNILNNSCGFTILPSGLLIAFGNAKATPPSPPSAIYTVNWSTLMQYATGWPGWTQIYSVYLTTASLFTNIGDNTFVEFVATNNTSLTVSSTQRSSQTAANAQFYFLAIGR